MERWRGCWFKINHSAKYSQSWRQRTEKPTERLLLFMFAFELLLLMFRFHASSSLFGDEDQKLAFFPMLLKLPLLLRQPPNGAEHNNNGLTHPNIVKPMSGYSIPGTNLCFGQRGFRLKRSHRFRYLQRQGVIGLKKAHLLLNRQKTTPAII